MTTATCILLVSMLLLASFVCWHAVERDDHFIGTHGKIHFLTLAHPKHPLLLSMAHTVLAPFHSLLTARLDPDKMIMAAWERVQHTPATAGTAKGEAVNLGTFDKQIRAGLRALTSSLLAEAGLSALGAACLRDMLVDALVAELQLSRLISRHPEVLDEEVVAPLFIAGFPRTGTTHLNALLSASGDFRFLKYYEASFPFAHLHAEELEGGEECAATGRKANSADDKYSSLSSSRSPPATINTSTPQPDVRIKLARDSLWYRSVASPLVPLLVDVAAETQAEDILLEVPLFTSMKFETLLHVPSYAAWYDTQDHDVEYSHTKLFLQALQFLDRQQFMRSERSPECTRTVPSTSSSPASPTSSTTMTTTDTNYCHFKPRRWVLKSPPHVSRLPNLMRVFPDAKVVVTHRDPQQMMKSACFLLGYLARLYAHSPSPTKVSRHAVDRLVRMSADLVTHEHDLHEKNENIMHVKADDYWPHAMETVQTIYSNLLGEPLRMESQGRMQGYLDTHPRKGAMAVEYDVHVLGLDEDEVEGRYGEQLQRYREAFLS